MSVRIGLSTASTYPESTAHAFAWAARLGYDTVEVMVGLDALSQQVSAVRQLSDHHGLPVCAVHAPCLLFTQRVWGTDPWGKLQRSAEMAEAVGADVVVVHPPFRWQREYARRFEATIRELAGEHGVEFAVENMFPLTLGKVTCHTCHRGQPVPNQVWFTDPGIKHAGGAAADNAKQNIAGAKVIVFDGLGHVPQEEDATRTVAAVVDFLGLAPLP